MRQVILCVETNKQANADVGYIDAVIKQLYQIGTEIKLQYKYFNGKGGYNAPKLLKEIKKDIAALKGGSSSEVIYCIDTDKYDSDAEVQKLNADIENFCHQNGYRFIWFCRDVEEVFLHTMKQSECVRAVLENGDTRMTLEFSPKDFPYMTQWKSMASGDYVLGIEPVTTPMSVREKNVLAPSESRTHTATWYFE